MLVFKDNWFTLEQEAWSRIKDKFFWEMDPEQWRSLACIGYAKYVITQDNRMYEIGEDGMVKELITPYLVGGYHTYILKRKVFNKDTERWNTLSQRITCHHLLAALFLEKPAGSRQVRFIDGDRHNIHTNNLEWK